MKRWGSTGDDDGAKAAKKNYTLFHTGINSIKGDTQSSVKLKVARWLKNSSAFRRGSADRAAARCALKIYSPKYCVRQNCVQTFPSPTFILPPIYFLGVGEIISSGRTQAANSAAV